MQVPPVMAALVSSQVIRAVILDISQRDPQTTKMLLDELAASLVELCTDIGQNPELGDQGETRQ
jgi:hypothetical protein